ncbi:MAG: hypothetical protein KJ757_00940 [Planctomycetes bacterium]|nr:hypothetical protein [Planctomycetota bacterium]MBU1517724.1 hypothetical protein [Planctomycetota bacterium]MBU2458077.1 hypothetical protein [Planctomycetota bacterium]MBU2596120.1 hypothetical protein [Planctomycetota bacterium]
MTGQEIQNEILRKMTPTQKVRLAMRLYYSAWEFKAAWLKEIHKDWSSTQIEQEVKRIFTNARS